MQFWLKVPSRCCSRPPRVHAFMAAPTWLDRSADGVCHVLEWLTASRHNDGPCFSAEQSKCLQRAFEDSLRAFANAIDSRFKAIEDDLEGKSSEVANRIAEVTVGQQEATSPDALKPTKNSRRKDRRRRVKNKFAVQRHQLLCMRPAADIHHVPRYCCSELRERVDKLEDSLAVYSGGQHSDIHGWAQAPWLDAMTWNGFVYQPSYECDGFTACEKPGVGCEKGVGPACEIPGDVHCERPGDACEKDVGPTCVMPGGVPCETPGDASETRVRRK